MRDSRAYVLFWQVIVGVVVISAWQMLVAVKLLDPFFFSRPSAIAGRIATWTIDGTLWRHLIVTIEESLREEVNRAREESAGRAA